MASNVAILAERPSGRKSPQAWQSPSGRVRTQPNQRRLAVILMYHRVAPVASDPWGLCVSPENFAQHLDVLTERCALVRLAELPDVRDNSPHGRLPVALTFDDGYADNLHNALPLLEQFGAAATFFVTTGAVSNPREYWWDELEGLLLEPGQLPKSLTVEVAGEVHQWALGDGACYTSEQARQHQTWRVGVRPPTPRHVAFLAIWERMYRATQEDKRQILDQIAGQAREVGTTRSSHRCLTRAEVVRLSQSDLAEIGAHSVTHSPLPLQPPDAQWVELVRSRTDLAAWVAKPIDSFAYPHGHVAATTADLARQAGFVRACGTAAGPVAPDTDQFLLPRIQVLDWSGSELQSRLELWQKGIL
jgi:peptidoglycan/xylan/chitin deacetylase (PgdA/CDA1 family)